MSIRPRSASTCNATAVDDRAKRAAHQHRRFRRKPEPARQRGERHRSQRHLSDGEGIDAPAEQPQALDLDFEAHIEQQEHDPQLGESGDRFDVVDQPDSRRADNCAGDEQAYHRPHA